MNRQGEMTQNETNIIIVDVLLYLRAACFIKFYGSDLICGAHNGSFLLISNRTGQKWCQSAGCLCSKQPNKTYELKWLGQKKSIYHTSMASKHFKYHSRIQTHDARRLMNSGHNLLDIHFVSIQYKACHAEVELENISTWHFVAKSDLLTKWKNDQLPMTD